MRSTILDEIEKFLNKKQKIDFDKIATIKSSSWKDAFNKSKKIVLKPGWAVYYVRSEGFVDHVSIVPKDNKPNLNLAEAKLLNATAPPIGTGVGPLSNDLFDISGLRISTAFEFIESYKGNHSYSRLLFGPPPTTDDSAIDKAGTISQKIKESGLIDGSPIVFSFGMLPVVKKFFVSYYDAKKQKAKITSIKKLHRIVIPLYCGGLVGEIWKRAGITGIPETKFLKMKGPSSFGLFKWSLENNTITGGISW